MPVPNVKPLRENASFNLILGNKWISFEFFTHTHKKKPHVNACSAMFPLVQLRFDEVPSEDGETYRSR